MLQFISIPEPLRRKSATSAEFQGIVCLYQNRGQKMECFSLILMGKLSKPKLPPKNFKNVTYC